MACLELVPSHAANHNINKYRTKPISAHNKSRSRVSAGTELGSGANLLLQLVLVLHLLPKKITCMFYWFSQVYVYTFKPIPEPSCPSGRNPVSMA